jgi:clan AA aspartic protease
MIVGAVNARYEIVIKVPLIDSAGQSQEVETMLDTGFNGSLTLPPTLVAKFGLPWRSRTSAVLATGAVEQVDVHAATIIWDGVKCAILVQVIDDVPLLGMGLLRGHELRARVTIGGNVAIEAIP